MQVGRRAVLALGVGVLAVGCSPEPPAADVPSPAPSVTSSPPPAAPSPSAPASPSRLPSAGPGLPTCEEIVDEFDGDPALAFGLDVDGVIQRSQSSAVCLTFDACGGKRGSGVDDDLLRVLEETQTPATLFLNARWIEANPDVTRRLAENPLFELANHGTAHLPLSVDGREAYGIKGTTSVAEVYGEIAPNQERLTALTGTPPRFFRAGTAHVDDVSVRICERLGLRIVNFDVNADAGATFTRKQVRAATVRAVPGSICIGHCNRPGSGTAAGIRDAIAQMRDVQFARLGDVLP